MRQGLAHYVKIDVVGDGAKCACNMRELLEAHSARGTLRARAKGAGAIADIGDFNVCA